MSKGGHFDPLHDPRGLSTKAVWISLPFSALPLKSGLETATTPPPKSPFFPRWPLRLKSDRTTAGFCLPIITLIAAVSDGVSTRRPRPRRHLFSPASRVHISALNANSKPEAAEGQAG